MKMVIPVLIALFIALTVPVLATNLIGVNSDGFQSAGRVSGGDEKDVQTAAFRSGIAAVDTPTTAGILATTEFGIKGKPVLIVSPRFSDSGANCKIRVVYIYKSDLSVGASSTSTSLNKIKGISDERTVTAGTTQFEGSYYPAPDEYYDGEGSCTVRVIITQAVSSGTVSFWVGSK